MYGKLIIILEICIPHNTFLMLIIDIKQKKNIKKTKQKTIIIVVGFSIQGRAVGIGTLSTSDFFISLRVVV
jgi:hypothetical protein